MDGARPVCSGLGRGGAAGDPSAAPPFPFSPPHIDPRGPPGPFFHAAGTCDRAPHPLAACLRAGRSHPCRQRGRTAPSPRRAPFLPGPFLPARGRSPRREPRGRAPGPGGLRPHAAPGGPPVHGGGAPGSAPSGGRPALRWRSRRHPARASLPAPGRAGRTGPRGAFRGHREGPPIWLPGARPASMSPSRLKRNRRIIPRAPAPLRE